MDESERAAAAANAFWVVADVARLMAETQTEGREWTSEITHTEAGGHEIKIVIGPERE